jgi:hypothetical protein
LTLKQEKEAVPSGGIDGQLTANRDEAEYVYQVLKDAQVYGLEYEFIEWFIGGLRQGMGPKEAAYAAALEWDF